MAQPKRKERDDAPDAPTTTEQEAQPVAESEGAWKLPPQASRNGLIVIIAVALLINLPMIHYFVFRPRAAVSATVPYQNDFSSNDALKDFWTTGGLWRVQDGKLLSPGVKNNPLWLKAKLPQNVSIEFDVRSDSPEGDIKCEIFGDGSDHATGYILIHGGWNNSLSIIARLDEHGQSIQQLQAEAQRRAIEQKLPSSGLIETGVFKADTRMRLEANPYPVQQGKQYHWKITRQGALITWFIDGNEFMRFEDPMPLIGEGHDRMGFSSWESQLFFDNLVITPL